MMPMSSTGRSKRSNGKPDPVGGILIVDNGSTDTLAEPAGPAWSLADRPLHPELPAATARSRRADCGLLSRHRAWADQRYRPALLI